MGEFGSKPGSLELGGTDSGVSWLQSGPERLPESTARTPKQKPSDLTGRLLTNLRIVHCY